MQITVTPISGTANQFTVALDGYRLAMSDTQENAMQVAATLRKSINRSGRKTPKVPLEVFPGLETTGFTPKN